MDADGGGRGDWHNCIEVNGTTPNSSHWSLSQSCELLHTTHSLKAHFVFSNVKKNKPNKISMI